MIKQRLFLTGWMLVLLTACTTDTEKVTLLAEPSQLPAETGKNILITYSDSGYTRAKVFAPYLERYTTDTRNETLMKKGITIYFYDKEMKVDSYLKSKWATRYDREKKMIARNDVVMVNKKGDTLNTEELIWDENTQRIYSDKFIRITTPEEIIMGEGFESNTAFTKYKIFSIRGTIRLD
ncbi:MAG: LPS export ABC transporter periplasmic protein LptC [Bacteroidia bacterium]|jgi:LPS export ABC transporter protein LptC|nr:LPS export ABC transporter periplasmic protein LptC [Bacteroidia bacterium]